MYKQDANADQGALFRELIPNLKIRSEITRLYQERLFRLLA